MVIPNEKICEAKNVTLVRVSCVVLIFTLLHTLSLNLRWQKTFFQLIDFYRYDVDGKVLIQK